MPTATSQAPSTPFPSRHIQPGIEPNKAWKDNLYKTVSETLQSMVDDVKRNYEECLALAYTEEAQSLVEEDYHRSMNHIRGLAKESFQAQLNRERQQRMRAVKRRSMQVEQDEITTRVTMTSQGTTTTITNYPSSSIFPTSSPSPFNELSASSRTSPRSQPTALVPPRGFEAQGSGSLPLEPHHPPILRPLRTRSKTTEAHDFPKPMMRTPSFPFYGLEMSLRPPDPIPTLGLPPIKIVPRDLPPELAARRNQYIEQGQSITKKGRKGHPRSLVATLTSPKIEKSSQLTRIAVSGDEIPTVSTSREIVASVSRDSYESEPSRSPSSYRPSYDGEEDGEKADDEEEGDEEEGSEDNEESSNCDEYSDSPSNDESSLWDGLEEEEEERPWLDEAARGEEEIQHKAGELAETAQDSKQEGADSQANTRDAFQPDVKPALATCMTPYAPSAEQESYDDAMYQRAQEQFCKEQDLSVVPMQALEPAVVLTEKKLPATYPANHWEEVAEAEAEEEETMDLEEEEGSQRQEEPTGEEVGKEEEAKKTEKERLGREQEADQLAAKLREQPSAEARKEEERRDIEQRKADEIWRQKQMEEVKRKQQEAYQRLEEQIRQQDRNRQQTNCQESTSSFSPLDSAGSRPSSRIPSSVPTWGTLRSSFFSARTSISSYQSIFEKMDDSMLGWQRRQEDIYRKQQEQFRIEHERMGSQG